MFDSKICALPRSKCHAAVLAMLCLLLSAAIGNAQGGGVGSTRGLPEAASGVHRIQGTVFLPNGRRAAEGILIKLDGNVVGTRRASTDGSGEFSFNSLPAADYSITIDAGPDYVPVRQSVLIYGNTGNVGMGNAGDTTRLDIHLQPKGPTDEQLFAGIPAAAVDKYKKARELGRSSADKKASEQGAKLAIEQLNGALAIYPNFPAALSELGTQYHKLNEMTKLAETMEALLKLKPGDPHAHLNLGIALYSQKKFEDAETHLREAVRLANTDAIAHYYLGVTLVGLKKYGDAEKELEAAIANGGDNMAQAHRYLGGLYMASKNPKAADELEKYLTLDPKAPDAERTKAAIKDLRTKQ
jgi:Flp pilus assembly protein TadD